MRVSPFCSTEYPSGKTIDGKISSVPGAPGSLVVFNSRGCGKERLDSQVLHGIILVCESYVCIALLIDLDIGLLQIEGADRVKAKKEKIESDYGCPWDNFCFFFKSRYGFLFYC
ncbi:MAG: hypothetical protein WCF90_06850 [Methanomicrobiales archaeon]